MTTESLIKQADSNIVLDKETGLLLPEKLYQSGSGILYGMGIRPFGNLNIVEYIAKGQGVEFLCGIKVFNNKHVLIIDETVPRGVRYQREDVRLRVLRALFNMLEEANTGTSNFDSDKAYRHIEEELKEVYYRQSYNAITEWAKENGIIN